MNQRSIETAIIGAGPYGLSAAAHLQERGLETLVFGTPMSFWREHMPAGMLLRSAWEASHIAGPKSELTLDDFAASRGRPIETPIPLGDFTDYGEWYLQQAGIQVDPRYVSLVRKSAGGFELLLQDGALVYSRSVVVAAGIRYFAWVPPGFAHLPAERVSHTSDHADLSIFGGKRIAVVGSGQSAIESASLLSEGGAQVELAFRRPQLLWLSGGRLTSRPRLRRILYPPTDVGPPGLNWIVALPGLFRTLPHSTQALVARRVLRPMAADWLRPRLQDVRLRAGSSVVSAEEEEEGLALKFDDASGGHFDHLLCATGYQVDVSRLPFLTELFSSLRLVRRSPRLGPGFESSVPGLYFVGAAATASFGPLMRFVAGTGYAARSVAAHLKPA